MAKLILHPSTQSEVEQFIQRPSHAAMLIGNEGMGKMALARQVAAQILAVENEAALDAYPYLRIIAPNGQSISIDTIRELLSFTKLKINNQQSGIRRLIIIDEAHTMTHEAQNALLKLLEEPPEGTLFLLNVANVHSLLPTIRSRVQQLQIKQPDHRDLEQYFTTQGFSAERVHSAYLMSGGLPGLLHALLSDSSEHPLLQAVAQARSVLRASPFERLAMVENLSKQKAELPRLLFVLQQMAHTALTQAAEKQSDTRSIKQWHRILTAAYDAQTALIENAQPKLVLTNLLLSM